MTDRTFSTKIQMIKEEICDFKQGCLYSIASRPNVGKTTLCIGIALDMAMNGKRVLYITDEVTPQEFKSKIESICGQHNFKNIVHLEKYHLNEEILSNLIDKEKCDFLIIDPFNIFAMDIDIGIIKEIAKEKGITILLSKQLARPYCSNSTPRPVLSDIGFHDEKTSRKFLAYVDVIIFLSHNPNISQDIIIAKNIFGETGELPIY